jgi:hypothetical protein
MILPGREAPCERHRLFRFYGRTHASITYPKAGMTLEKEEEIGNSEETTGDDLAGQEIAVSLLQERRVA